MARRRSGSRPDQLRVRARQQAAVADLGQRALAGAPLAELIDTAAATSACELGTDYASVLELTDEGSGLLVRAATGFPPGALGTVLSAEPDQLPGYALRSNVAVVTPDFAGEERFRPSEVQQAAGVVSAMAAPIGARGRHFGVIAVHALQPHHFSADDAHFLTAVANVLGAAAERARHEEALRESEAGFRELADTAPVMLWTTATDGLVTFVNEGWLSWTGTRFEDELGASWALGVHPEDEELVLGSWDQRLAAREPWELEYRLRTHTGDYRWVVDRGVPRYEGGVFVGYVGAAVDIHERKTMEGQLLAIYEREHDIAATLQRSLLPQRLPHIEGLELAARYLPAARGASIGGDWYDALERPDGRVALVVGDVVGHGLRAAATMGQLRNAFRAYGLVEDSPAEVVARLNRLVTIGVEEAMATVLYLVLDRETGEVAYACAGHPPPLVLAPDGPRFLEGGRSVPVGAADPVVFRESRERLEPGSTLLLYTDGLVERRDVPLGERLDELAEAARGPEVDLETLCDRLLAAVLGDAKPSDDVALLAVRPLAAGADQISVSLPAEPESLTGLRRRLSRFLHAAGASEIEAYEITLAICEAAGNAIEHAYGPGDATFDVEAALADGELAATVRDRGNWRERRSEHRGRGLRIIEGLMDEVDVASEDGGTVVKMRRRLEAARAA